MEDTVKQVSASLIKIKQMKKSQFSGSYQSQPTSSSGHQYSQKLSSSQSLKLLQSKAYFSTTKVSPTHRYDLSRQNTLNPLKLKRAQITGKRHGTPHSSPGNSFEIPQKPSTQQLCKELWAKLAKATLTGKVQRAQCQKSEKSQRKIKTSQFIPKSKRPAPKDPASHNLSLFVSDLSAGLPIFGYPLLCFSPKEDAKQYWTLIAKSLTNKFSDQVLIKDLVEKCSELEKKHSLVYCES